MISGLNKHFLDEFLISGIGATNRVKISAVGDKLACAVPLNYRPIAGVPDSGKLELYIQTYNTRGEAKKKCDVKQVTDPIQLTQVQMETLMGDKVVITWAERNVTANVSNLKMQIIDTKTCDSLATEILISTQKGQVNQQPFHILTYPAESEKYSFLQLISERKEVLKCTASLCKQTFSSTGIKIDNTKNFLNGKLGTSWKIAARSNNEQDGYIYVELTDKGQGRSDVQAKILGTEGNVWYSKMLTEAPSAKQSLALSLGPDSFWTCITENYYPNSKARCLEADYNLNLLTKGLPFFEGAMNLGSLLAPQALTNNNLLVFFPACAEEKCYHSTAYIQELESKTGNFTPQTAVPTKLSSIVNNQLEHLNDGIYCSAYRNGDSTYGRCLDVNHEYPNHSAAATGMGNIYMVVLIATVFTLTPVDHWI